MSCKMIKHLPIFGTLTLDIRNSLLDLVGLTNGVEFVYDNHRGFTLRRKMYCS